MSPWAKSHTRHPRASGSVGDVILGLDVGRARIGLARAERGSALAFGRGWIDRRGTRSDVEAVKALATEEAATLVVVGLPRPTRGRDSSQTRLARDFAEALERAGVPVALEDERFTTALAERRLRTAAPAGGRRAKGTVDEASAVAILESFLERTRPGAEQRRPADDAPAEAHGSGGEAEDGER